MRVVLDTNVVIRWVLESQDVEGSASFVREKIINREFEAYILSILLFETPFVLKKKRGIYRSDPLQITSEIRDHIFSLPIIIDSLYIVDLEKAIKLAIKYDTNIFDSSNLIFAKQIEAILITADEKFANKFKDDPSICKLNNIREYTSNL